MMKKYNVHIEPYFDMVNHQLVPKSDLLKTVKIKFGKYQVGASNCIIDSLRKETLEGRIPLHDHQHNYHVALHLDLYNEAYKLHGDKVFVYTSPLQTILKMVRDTILHEHDITSERFPGGNVHAWYESGRILEPHVHGPVVLSHVYQYYKTGDAYAIDSCPDKQGCLKFLGDHPETIQINHHYPIFKGKYKEIRICTTLPKLYAFTDPSFDSIYTYFGRMGKTKLHADNGTLIEIIHHNTPPEPDDQTMYVVMDKYTFKSFHYSYPNIHNVMYVRDLKTNIKQENIVLVFRSKWEMNTYLFANHPFVENITRVQGIAKYYNRNKIYIFNF